MTAERLTAADHLLREARAALLDELEAEVQGLETVIFLEGHESVTGVDFLRREAVLDVIARKRA
jgi:hypothetical protein